MFMSHDMIDQAQNFPYMDGQAVFKKAVVKFPEVIMEALKANGYQPADLKMLIPHQANLRISQFVQHKLQLRDDQVHNNIQHYGNTTAASVPIALCEAWEQVRYRMATWFAWPPSAAVYLGQRLAYLVDNCCMF
jgi:3-oxoacyl-[acyl-carrier-protein] synthase-3